MLPFLFVANVIFSASMSFIWTFFTKIIIDSIQNGSQIKDVVFTVIICAGIQLFCVLLNTYTSNNLWWRFIRARMLICYIRINKCLEMDYELLETPKMLDIHQKALDATGGNDNGVEGLMRTSRSTIMNIVLLIAAAGVMLVANPLIILVIIGLGILNFIFFDFSKKYDKKNVWDALAPLWRKNDYFYYSSTDFSCAKDIRLFSLQKWFSKKYEDVQNIIHSKISLSKKIWSLCTCFNTFFAVVQEGCLYAWLIYSYLNEGMSIGNFTLYLGIVRTFFNALNEMLKSIATMREQSREVNDFRTFVEYSPEDENNKEYLPIPKCQHYDFLFENVSFKYKNSDKFALKDMTIHIKGGEKLAVVGLNGAGKTTFIKLMMRLYKPTSGRILLNGIDIQNFDKKEYFTLFSPLFQEVYTFAFPISENVSMQSAKETSESLAEQKLRIAGLGEKIDSLEKGIKTEMLKIMYDDGIDFSGGEKQKLALARALYKNSPIVILDEPTSALDALAEYNMYKSFDKIISGKTAIYISHRLSSTRFCDNIAMFKDGSICEYGNHYELLEKGGEYSQLFNVQAQYYKDKKQAQVNLEEVGANG